MRKFYLFAGDNTKHNQGGMFDFRGDFSTVEGAKRIIEQEDYLWAHIFDTEKRMIIIEYDFQRGYKPCKIGVKRLRSGSK